MDKNKCLLTLLRQSKTFSRSIRSEREKRPRKNRGEVLEQILEQVLGQVLEQELEQVLEVLSTQKAMQREPSGRFDVCSRSGRHLRKFAEETTDDAFIYHEIIVMIHYNMINLMIDSND